MASSDVLLEHVTGEFSEIALCSICTDKFADPRLLACRHTFCLKCLQRCAERKHCGEPVACPICRQETVIPSGGMVKLERNRDIERLVETSHRVESRLKEGLYHCGKHDGKPVILYCVTCSCLLCSTCIVSSHAGHQYQETDSAADDLMEQLEARLGPLGHSVSGCLAKLRAKVTQINRMSKTCQKSAAESRAKVLDRCKEIEALIAADRDSVLSELGVPAKELLDLKNETRNFIEKLQSYDNLREGGKRPLDVISVCSELLQLPVEDVLSREICEASLSFEPNVKLLKLESKAVNLVGTVSHVSVKKPAAKVKGFIGMLVIEHFVCEFYDSVSDLYYSVLIVKCLNDSLLFLLHN